MKQIRAIILAILVLSMPAVAEDWPQFRGPSGQGISNARDVPIKWSASENVVWTQTNLGFMSVHGNAGSPVLLDGMLIFNCDGARNPFIVALDANNGEVKWKTPRNTPSRAMFSFSTPLAIDVDGATQIVSPASGIVAAYEPAHGNEI